MNLTKTSPAFIESRLSGAEWKKLKKCHRSSIAGLIDDYLDRRREQAKDPVLDFLFEYYAFRPSHLKRWSPGFGVLLEGTRDSVFPEISELQISKGGAFLDPGFFPEKRKSSLRWMLEVLEKTREKKPSFGCFGMHEWAMVYKREKVRHNHIPLRLGKEELADFVESRPLVCTHYDAFRFFSPRARPLNKNKLSRESFAGNEQGGCIHTNMDLYKWAFKGFPWISSESIRQAFELALEARVVDMKASPYDLRKRGLEPIKIETEEGRLHYVNKQKEIYRKSIPIRGRLIEEYRKLAEYFEL